MTEITCQDCHRTLAVDDATIERGMADGSIIEGEYVTQQRVGSGETDFRNSYTKALLYICHKCQRKAPSQVNDKVSPLSIVANESAEIQRILARVRDMNPDWTLEEAAHEAVERFNDVSRIKHEGFRAYLIHREVS